MNGGRLQLLCVDGCPNWLLAEARLHEALGALGRTAEVEKVLATTPRHTEQ